MTQNNLYSIFIFSYLFVRVRFCSSLNLNFKACQPTTCGNLTISYPFYIEGRQKSFSGGSGVGLSCSDNGLPILNIFGIQYFIHEISYTNQSIRVSEAATLSSNSNSCVIPRIHNISLDVTRFSFAPNQMDLFLMFECNLESLPEYFSKYRIGCSAQNEATSVLAITEEGEDLRSASEKCIGGVATTKVEKNSNIDGQVMRRGFLLNYYNDAECSSCQETGWKCGFNGDPEGCIFKCYCPDSDPDLKCGSESGLVAENPSPVIENSRPGRMKLTIGITSGTIGGTLLICSIIFCCKIKSLRQKIEFFKTSRADQNIEAFIRNQGPLALTRYKFAEVKKMTKSFQVKLGQGGYGAVYKGELLNGCPVAVKLLKSSKGNGEEFINEVASISRTSHVNVVTLLGFCLEGHKKALIYEFMSNGSLDKFIHDKVDKTSPSLTWENLYHIAIGTARGLEYLYKGCNPRILHFDIKPHNILLDESFYPKISNFGLAKLYPRKESIISITEARGTIGYLAPEVWNRNIGGISHKSDVYSYGMMLLDMVGGRKNMNDEANCTTEIYFPDWIFEKLEEGSNLGDDGANAMEENDIARRMTIVGLWCTQTFPTQRPTISRVIEMLEGSLDSLPMPPKPVMPSPPARLELESSSTANTEKLDLESSSLMLERH
ncbi:LEAF RUST 10 DISEASE-RESISTANCE LOCUS RECEPTOR-LIKE PROTEIN KINASE-like 2.4 isoform X2 [Prosopis cineraria]|uniref:LEAF RUST 10 DISEASE-RESISTANCE LOCUS RECEPTOR-LIKE PROTEIN KINASE-like 2.4 isoform X2 n=1 Tax=Prosopis cineraria TaxID=364024 RepID=UPI002410AE96|nr:LEAF RUST 10 DISEASE-RESISTANCE LOCUS RECEPTOR-LIKE PROTEIN KINASE-like 2.4 isoform X2 [Prosopis cineraria]